MANLEESVLEERSFFQKIADIYFKPKVFEKSGKLYEALGVKYFKRFIVKLGDLVGKKRNPYRLRRRLTSEKGLKKFDTVTRIAELIHSPAVVYFGHRTIHRLSNEDYIGAAMAGAFGLLNLYLTMTQRYNRSRIYTLLGKRGSVKQGWSEE
jgi:hypothetical protein